jgi:endonuclease III related protein
MSQSPQPSHELHQYYRRLLRAYGPQSWWPADSPFEVIVGAILTQNTNWRNVERAILNLKRQGLMSPEALRKASRRGLAAVIRPSGYFNIKAGRLKSFVRFLMDQYKGDLDRMFGEPTNVLRRRLLKVRGIGPETADSILLYAGGHPVFVIDAYTRRVLGRHRLVSPRATYGDLQTYIMSHLYPDATEFNEYHALLVKVGKEHCGRKPTCSGCPLEDFLGGRRPKALY